VRIVGTMGIEAFGSTKLVQVGKSYFLQPIGGSSGPELSISGAPVVAGQFGAWMPIGAEQTASGYAVAWKYGAADQYTVWTTNSSGAFISNIGVVSGSSAALESNEPSLQQDLNGDGQVGVVTTVVEAVGSTKLVQVGSNYFLHPIGGSSGPELSIYGAPFVAGQFGAWTPIGAEQTASGYTVAWKNGGADQYTVWTTNSSGAFISNIGVVSGSDTALASVEPSLQQDLNGDGRLGVPTTVVEAVGSTKLVQVGSNYFLYPIGGSSGPELSIYGAPFVAGQFGAWAPIGAEQTASGYMVAWKNGGADQYTVWTTNTSGAFISNIGVVSGSNTALASVEPSLQQDLNGDGRLGVPTTVVEAIGSTKLVQVGSNYFLYPIGGSSGPELSIYGAPFAAGQFGAWAPIGAEQTASGYTVAWKNGGADQYTVWTTDSTGAFISNIGVVSGSNTALTSVEPSLQQDLNGDGRIGVATTASVTTASTQSASMATQSNLTIDAGTTLELSSAYNGTVTFTGSTGTLKLDASSSFAGTIAGMTGQDTIDLVDMSFATVQAPVFSGDSTHGTLTVTDGTDIAQLALEGNYLASSWTLSDDGNGGTNVVDPPLDLSTCASLETEAIALIQPVEDTAPLSRIASETVASQADARIPNLALLSSYLASTFVTSPGEAAGSFIAAQPSEIDAVLSRPVA
jgi:serralysin